MKKSYWIVFILLLFFSPSLIAQDIQVFTLREFEKSNKDTVAFVSLSEIYPLSDHPDSLPIPDTIGKTGYLKLDAKYRKRLLNGTKISETDKVFVYDYANDILQTFTVKDLAAVAWLNIYTYIEECPCPPYYYMIGFEINSKLLKGLSNFYTTTLVCIGKENPFARGKLKPITWKKIASKKYQSAIAGIKDTAGLPNPARGQVHAYETTEFQYFVEDEYREEWITTRHLLILKTKTKEIVYSAVYIDDEGTSPSPLNGDGLVEQWTGKLFNNKPTVIFSFQYHSFGCPYITVLDEPVYHMGINCDNRH